MRNHLIESHEHMLKEYKQMLIQELNSEFFEISVTYKDLENCNLRSLIEIGDYLTERNTSKKEVVNMIQNLLKSSGL